MSFFVKPRCPKCNTKLILSYTEPLVLAGFHEPRFICNKCGYVYTAVPVILKKQRSK